MSANA